MFNVCSGIASSCKSSPKTEKVVSVVESIVEDIEQLVAPVVSQAADKIEDATLAAVEKVAEVLAEKAVDAVNKTTDDIVNKLNPALPSIKKGIEPVSSVPSTPDHVVTPVTPVETVTPTVPVETVTTETPEIPATPVEVSPIIEVQKVKRAYKLKRDDADPTDVLFDHEKFSVTHLPKKIDMRNTYMPPVVDQGQLGSCTANAICAAFAYQNDYQHKPATPFAFSRLFLYYQERLMEGTVGEDDGAQIADGVKSLYTIGACPESTWPYDVSKFAVKPSEEAYKEALAYTALKCLRVASTVIALKTALSKGTPVIIGMQVPVQLENVTSTGIMAPYKKGGEILGGHAVLMVGYDDTKVADNTTGYFIVRNSWGTDFGVHGYFFMSYDFVHQSMLDDCWVIQNVK